MRFIKTLLKTSLTVLEVFILVIVLYFIMAHLLWNIQINSDNTSYQNSSIDVYLISNGVHTDIALPISNEEKNWNTFINPSCSIYGGINANYICFGWGDKVFYLNTPNWSDLTFKTAFCALFNLSSTAMHINYYEQIKESNTCVKISMCKDNYLKLITYIEQSFQMCSSKPILIDNAHYCNHDAFFEANGTYNLFNTCNTWVNKGLKTANLKACLWTPFDKPLLNLYQ